MRSFESLLSNAWELSLITELTYFELGGLWWYTKPGVRSFPASIGSLTRTKFGLTFREGYIDYTPIYLRKEEVLNFKRKRQTKTWEQKKWLKGREREQRRGRSWKPDHLSCSTFCRSVSETRQTSHDHNTRLNLSKRNSKCPKQNKQTKS